MKHALTGPAGAGRLLVLLTLACASLRHALAVITGAHRRWPLLSFALFEVAAVLAGTVIALALLLAVA